MNMTRQTVIVMLATVLSIVAAVTILLAMGRNPDRLIDLVTLALIPAALTIWAGNRADKAKQVAEQAVHNTNGRMGQMIQATIDSGGKVDVDEYSDVLKHQDITVPEEQAIHSGNPDPAFRDFEVTKREDI